MSAGRRPGRRCQVGPSLPPIEAVATEGHTDGRSSSRNPWHAAGPVAAPSPPSPLASDRPERQPTPDSRNDRDPCHRSTRASILVRYGISHHVPTIRQAQSKRTAAASRTILSQVGLPSPAGCRPYIHASALRPTTLNCLDEVRPYVRGQGVDWQDGVVRPGPAPQWPRPGTIMVVLMSLSAVWWPSGIALPRCQIRRTAHQQQPHGRTHHLPARESTSNVVDAATIIASAECTLTLNRLRNVHKPAAKVR